jgi:hypothetical protein
MIRLLTTCLLVALAPEANAQTSTPDFDLLARVLVERMALEPGERVLLVGRPGYMDALVAPLGARVRATGAEYLGALSVADQPPEAWETNFTRQARGRSRAQLVSLFAGVDLAVMLPGPTPLDTPYAAMQDVLRSGRARTIHFHWAGAYDRTGVLLPVTDEIGRVYQRALAETDYAALARLQRRFEDAMRGGDVHVTTPLGTDLRFRIGDRPMTRQDGDASARRARQARNLIDREVELPAGAVRVAPIEETVEGRIAFPPSIWSGERVEGLVLTLRGGQVVAVVAATGRTAVEAELARAGEAGRWFREFALGMNVSLAVPADGSWIPYYGYGAGVVRLSLGDNTELGGKVGGGYVRWNFFTDATVTVGGDTWVQDGRLVAR